MTSAPISIIITIITIIRTLAVTIIRTLTVIMIMDTLGTHPLSSFGNYYIQRFYLFFVVERELCPLFGVSFIGCFA